MKYELCVDGQMPFLILLFSDLKDYHFFKSTILIEYDKLVKKEANIEQFYIDPEGGIFINIDFDNRGFNLAVNDYIINEKEIDFSSVDVKEFIQDINNIQGIFLHVVNKSNELMEEFVINVFNVAVNNLPIRSHLDIQSKNLLKLPGLDWYQEKGYMGHGGIAVGLCYEENSENAIMLLYSYTEQEYEFNTQLFREAIIVKDDFLKNISVIIDEIDEDRILIRFEIIKLDNNNEFETTTPILITENYKKFKDTYIEKKFAYFIHKKTVSENIGDLKYKINNIIFVDNNVKNSIVKWTEPNLLDIGGLDAQKKILINEDNMEVGIYKYFMIRDLNSRNIKKIVNELISYNLAKSILLPVAEVQLHMETDTIGIISKLVKPPVYKLNDIDINLIENFNYLIDMVAFDVFVYNTDRHCDNICLVKNADHYSPIFIDHSRCLGGIESHDLHRLNENKVNVCLNLVGLGCVSEKIDTINQFENIIFKIQKLDIKSIIENVITSELEIYIKSVDAYEDGFLNLIIDYFEYRKLKIYDILKESLSL
jgi:hypothetical protein